MVIKRRPAAARRIQNLVRRAAVALTAFTSKGGGCPVTLGGVARILTPEIAHSAKNEAKFAAPCRPTALQSKHSCLFVGRSSS
jgi:hypothetical protein